MDYNGNNNQAKELEVENTLTQEKNNFPEKLKIELNNEEKNEKTLKNEEENNQNNENDDSLSTLYRSSQSSFNINSKDIEFTFQRRLSSNISTSQSDINYQELNGFSSEKKFYSQKSIKRIQPINLFDNDFGNLIINYYKDTEEYLKNLYLNKNNYKKTKNYIEKEIYYRDYDDNIDYIKYKTIDFSEENKNKTIENDKTNSNNSFISLNKDFVKNNEEKPLNDLNKINNKNNNEQNKNNIHITNINNNYYVNQIFLNPNNNFNTINGSKYDVSMYYLGYYSFDCKS